MNWEDIPTNLKRTDQISTDLIEVITYEYNFLLSQPNPSLQDLTQFISLLSKYGLKSEADFGEMNPIDDFIDSGLEEKVYPGKVFLSAYNTILHEMGHQFGMAHSDQRQGADLTGFGDTLINQGHSDFPHIVEESAMSLSSTYLHLTQDDIDGVRMVQKLVKKYFRIEN